MQCRQKGTAVKPYFRAQPGKTEGTRLGLSIAKSIAMAHGGTLVLSKRARVYPRQKPVEIDGSRTLKVAKMTLVCMVNQAAIAYPVSSFQTTPYGIN
ncbi:sensor histidine kinase [Caballeronia sordidicola]|uniref:Uncharacterized protein n=1 Tax=Caballeronia sordidicola TaxID=196367 RepID=A0A226X9S6_CABSO|nr:sensor histidine kinase [Caballeronia sordidicola]OXC79869.1 hypothetical protein BSU04_04845 [Caballeronia sordidicola]